MERQLIRIDNLPDQAGITAALRRAFAARPMPPCFRDEDPFEALLSNSLDRARSRRCRQPPLLPSCAAEIPTCPMTPPGRSMGSGTCWRRDGSFRPSAGLPRHAAPRGHGF